MEDILAKLFIKIMRSTWNIGGLGGVSGTTQDTRNSGIRTLNGLRQLVISVNLAASTCQILSSLDQVHEREKTKISFNLARINFNRVN